jgi:hypothetical protein
MFSSVFLVTKKPTGTKSKSSNQNQNQNWILFPPSTGPRTGIKFYLKNKGNGHQVHSSALKNGLLLRKQFNIFSTGEISRKSEI